MVSFGIEVKDKELRRALAAGGKRLYPYLYAGLRRSFGAYRREFNRGTHMPGQEANIKKLKIKNLRQRGPKWGFFWESKPKNETQGDLDDIRVEFYTSSVVAQVLEEGTTIRPKTGRTVAIPVGFAKTPTGRTKRAFLSPAKARKAGYDLRYIPRRGGRGPFLAVAGRKSRTGTASSRRRKTTPLKVVFVLVPSAKIRPQLGFYAGWDRFAPERQKRIVLELERFLREVWGQTRTRST